MPWRNNRLIFLTLALLGLAVYFSCSQPDDVLTRVSSTKVTLGEQRLPTLPDGVTYELWVANDEDTVSMGKFLYDHRQVRYLETDGTTERTNEFILDDDIYDYEEILLSIESVPDGDLTSPGPIMLTSEVSPDPMQMLFPAYDTLYNSIVRYNMEGVSDNNRYSNDGRGVWFTTYQSITIDLNDTLGFTYRIDSVIRGTLELEIIYDDVTGESIGVDTTNKDAIFVYDMHSIDSVWLETTLVSYGPDTLTLNIDSFAHIGVRYHIDSMIDSTPPYHRHYFRRFNFEPVVEKTITLDLFTQDEFNLPDYSDRGWRYNGWIVSPYIDPNVITTRITPPAWPFELGGISHLPGHDGAMLSTGKFSEIDGPDEKNPFRLSDKIPQYPGEDFLNSTAMLDSLGIGSVNFMPSSTANEGSVFITLEPDNFTGNTNFPLFVMIRGVSANRGAITGELVQETMTNWTRFLDNDLYGFPKIIVDIERF
jgi:hypothetical protein